MGNDWIIDVLADVRTFARRNDMPQLCAQLDEAMLVAATEVSDLRQRRAKWQGEHAPQSDTQRAD